MIESVWNFYKRGMRGFGRRLFATTHPYLSGVLSYAICHYATTRSPVKFSNFTPTFVTYDTVVFGFTATAVALAIAIPSVTFLAFLSNEKNGRTAFRDFLFVLAWNGVVHIVAFFVLLPSVILGDNWILSKDSSPSMKIYLFLVLWSQFYACFQFLVTTIGVYELGDLYANYISKNRVKVTTETTQN